MTRSDEAQMLTLEAIMAAMILVAAAFFLTQFVPTETVGAGDDLSRVQLTKYGQDAMTMATTKSLTPSVGFKLNLYREWNSTEDDDEKWHWDENGTEDGSTYGGTEIDVDNKTIYNGVGDEWTDAHLVINSSSGENSTVWFVNRPRGGRLANTSGQGTLKQLTPFTSGDILTEHPDADRLDFERNQKEVDKGYGMRILWFESDSGDVGNPLFFWLDREPSEHSDIVSIDYSRSQGESIKYWRAARVSRRQDVYVEVDSSNVSGGSLHVKGPGVDIATGKKSANGDNIDVDYLGDDGGVYSYRITFIGDALSGYLISWGSGDSFQWEDPVFVIVGQAATVGRQLTPLDNILSPIKQDYFSQHFEPMLDRVLPRNVDYSFALYALDGSDEVVVRNSAGEKLEVNGDRIPIDPVVINRFITASNGTRKDVYNARLELWYR